MVTMVTMARWLAEVRWAAGAMIVSIIVFQKYMRYFLEAVI